MVKRINKGRKIVILGANIDKELLLIELDAIRGDYELWSMNNVYTKYQDPKIRFSRWFELHKFERKNNRYIRRNSDRYQGTKVSAYMKEIDGLCCPVYMQKKWRIIKNSTLFPFEKIIARYGKYFGCSFAWMTALALMEHGKGKRVSEIIYIGVALSGHEYYFQRPSTEYMIGIAKAKGINITIGAGSNLLQERYIYAYREDPAEILTIHGEFMKLAMTNFASSFSGALAILWDKEIE